MSADTKQSSTQRDANLAADERPVPSQAEGDRDTIEQDIAHKEKNASDKTPANKAAKDNAAANKD